MSIPAAFQSLTFRKVMSLITRVAVTPASCQQCKEAILAGTHYRSFTIDASPDAATSTPQEVPVHDGCLGVFLSENVFLALDN